MVSISDSEDLRETWEAAPLIEGTCTVPPPPTMVSTEAKCLLAGDCCHSLHPFLSQGLNLGLEDAATLGQLLSHVDSPSQLPDAIALYDSLRTNRARKVDSETWVQVEQLRHVGGGLKRLHVDAGECSNKVQTW